MEIITEQFKNKYKDKTPDWGYSGLGYIVYKRTYSRLKENGELEVLNKKNPGKNKR